MKRTTISLPDDLAALTEREASRRNTSVSEVVRSALRSALRPSDFREIPWAGMVDDQALVAGRDVEEALSESWADDIDGDR